MLVGEGMPCDERGGWLVSPNDDGSRGPKDNPTAQPHSQMDLDVASPSTGDRAVKPGTQHGRGRGSYYVENPPLCPTAQVPSRRCWSGPWRRARLPHHRPSTAIFPPFL